MSAKNVYIDTKAFAQDDMLIQGTRVKTHVGMIDQAQLKFFPDNPRVYSIVHEEGRTPTQDEIQDKLEEMEHVKALVQDIKKHGGVLDPLVVKDGSMEVVEGNSRLAAYRMLARISPAKWAQVKCRVLPADVDDSLVASLLGQWHLKGKKEWPPFEQAGYLHRRHHDQRVSFTALAAEAGISQGRVEKIIEAYQLMVDQGDTKRDRWSYYDEFVKSRKIAKACAATTGFRERVLDMVKDGEFERAQDLRDMLPVICDGPARVRTKFAAGKLSLEDAHDAAEHAGGADDAYKKLNKFRLWLAGQDVADHILDLDRTIRDKVDFELKRIQTQAAALLKKH